MNLSLKPDPEAARAIESMKTQLLIVLVERLGGDVTIPVSEVDTVPVGRVMTFELDEINRSFRFTTPKINAS